MATALYRRYRPDTFADMIGQSQVTDPLMTALRTGRVNHAYLFSGPRGCGKTSSARILARCLNCAEGPTDTPCGVCDSCRELARDGMGSLDVVEIDAASHGGVDDARDLRDRAILAPARDRYKIFIIDEAHMVSAAGFNALLKVVEEPPEHVRFVFATTEPEKVIGTIRSRTHHFPFRLIPPALMLEYLEKLCAEEGVEADAGVLPLVVRAGGGSARDTLSLLDQIIGGSEGRRLDYERAAALLGFTSSELLDATVAAFAAQDAAAAYRAIDRVIQSGQDPRRFVEDLLERLRDLIVVAATGESAGSVLRGTSPDELDRLRGEAAGFTPTGLAGMADLVDATLTEMTGVTSPRLHLELMVARILVAFGARFDGPGRLADEIGPSASADADARRSTRADAASEQRPAADDAASAAPIAERNAAPTAERDAAPTAERDAAATAGRDAAATAERDATPAAERREAPSASTATERTPEVTEDQFRHAWPSILEHVKRHGRLQAWTVVMNVRPIEYKDGVFGFEVQNRTILEEFKEHGADHVRAAVSELLGVTVKFRPRVIDRQAPVGEPGGGSPHHAAPADGPSADRGSASGRTASGQRHGDGAGGTPSRGPGAPKVAGWNVVAIPGADTAPEDGPGSAWDEEATTAGRSEPDAPASALAGMPSDEDAPEIIAVRESAAREAASMPERFDPTKPADGDAKVAAERGDAAPEVGGPTSAPAEARHAPGRTASYPDDEPPLDDEPPYDEEHDGPALSPGERRGSGNVRDQGDQGAGAGRGSTVRPAAEDGEAAAGAAPASGAIAASGSETSASAPSSTGPRIATSTAVGFAASASTSDVATTGGLHHGIAGERYGEAVIREQLGARFIDEQPLAPISMDAVPGGEPSVEPGEGR